MTKVEGFGFRVQTGVDCCKEGLIGVSKKSVCIRLKMVNSIWI